MEVFIFVYKLRSLLPCRWLQPDRAVDPEASELELPSEPIKAGLSSEFLVHTKDQDGKPVFVNGMKVSERTLT